MKKKWLIAGVFLTCILTQNVYAENSATVSYTVNPSYTVMIPRSTTVEFNKLTESYGRILIEEAQIDEGKCIRVSLKTEGTLKNEANSNEIIPYKIVEEGKTTPFVSANYHTAGEATPLEFHINQKDWNKAAAGDYKDTVTFTISYVNE